MENPEKNDVNTTASNVSSSTDDTVPDGAAHPAFPFEIETKRGVSGWYAIVVEGQAKIYGCGPFSTEDGARNKAASWAAREMGARLANNLGGAA